MRGPGSTTPPVLNPLVGQKPPVPGRPDPSDNVRRWWSEVAVDHDLPFIKETKRLLDSVSSIYQTHRSRNVKP